MFKVNLPAHLVIIKNTQAYLNNKMTELSEMDVLQMIGRAGRPQYDNTGVAVILTRSDKRLKYENLVSGKTPLESRLHLQLIDHINAEIGLGTIADAESAKKWLRSTFFHVRCRANPKFYGLDATPGEVEKMVESVCLYNLERLLNASLVGSSSGKLHLTAYGEAAAKYCVRFQTAEMIVGMNGSAKLKYVVRTYQSRSLTV
jgi:ATP-dependent DNA helicase HFM1/MER3